MYPQAGRKEYRGMEIEVLYDEYSANPRKDFDNLSTMWLTPDSGYVDLSDEDADFVGDQWDRIRYVDDDYRDPSDEPEELAKLIERTYPGSVAEPVYLDNHKGVAYVLPDTIRKEWSKQRISAKVRALVRECIKAEINILDAWCKGEVYGYLVYDPESAHPDDSIDSLWGIYDLDYGLPYVMSQAREFIDYELARREKQRAAALAEHERIAAATAAHWGGA